MQNVHPPSSTPPAWDSRQKKSRTRAPGLSSARGTIWGARGSRVRLADGLARTKQTPTSVPTVPYSIPDPPPVSCTAGRQPQWRTHWKSRAVVENPGFWRGCAGDGKWPRSAETRMVRRHSGYRRQCLCRAKFQYRSAMTIVQGGCSSCRAKPALAQPVKRS